MSQQLRRLVRDEAERLGHALTTFEEYPSTPGKYTAYCKSCGLMAIVYDEIPVGDQIAGKALHNTCAGT